jgi:hypothetical protein
MSTTCRQVGVRLAAMDHDVPTAAGLVFDSRYWIAL